ncbi:transposase [Bacillus cereus]|uniref:transposase n=1 Tax=Bacillus cereus TaxID=1396 RepID=UPI000A411D72|nr:transposase [Bacillus cereus]
MKKQYDEMLKKQCVELVVKEGRTISSIQREFDLGNVTLNAWIKNILSHFWIVRDLIWKN